MYFWCGLSCWLLSCWSFGSETSFCPRYCRMNLITVRPYSWSVSCMTIGTATAIAAKINPKRTVRSRLLQQQQQPLLPHVLMLVAEVFYNQTFGLGRMWKNGGFGRSLICSQFFWEKTAKHYNLISHFFCFKYSFWFSAAQ